SLRTPTPAFATFWPPAGILLAALVLSPARCWPAILVAACAANLVSDVLLHDKSIGLALSFCAANCLEACAGASLLRRFVGLRLTLGRIREVLGLACWSALISTMLGATIGAGAASLAAKASFLPAWPAWWIADAVGVLTVAPVALTWTA